MQPYYYHAKIVKVYDGDTCTCEIDLGFNITRKVKIRLVGINTPEIRTRDLEEKEAGYISRDWLAERILNKKVLLHTAKQGKFGRWLGTIWTLEQESPNFENSYNKEMISEGLAKEYWGGKR